MNFVNLTPHAINVHDLMGNLVLTVPPSGDVARVDVNENLLLEKDDVPFFVNETGDVVGLPDSKEDHIFIVSMVVRNAVPHRNDVASPGLLLRDDDGKPKGCRGLVVNL